MNMLKNFWNHRIGTAESPEITIVSPTENYYLLGGGGEITAHIDYIFPLQGWKRIILGNADGSCL